MSQVAHIRQELISLSAAWSNQEYFYTLLTLDGILLHCRVTPSIEIICQYPFVHLGGERHRRSKELCQRTQHKCPWPGFEPGPMIWSQAHWPWGHSTSTILLKSINLWLPSTTDINHCNKLSKSGQSQAIPTLLEIAQNFVWISLSSYLLEWQCSFTCWKQKGEDLLDLIATLLKFNCFLSTIVAMQCTFQSSLWWIIDYCRHTVLLHHHY